MNFKLMIVYRLSNTNAFVRYVLCIGVVRVGHLYQQISISHLLFFLLFLCFTYSIVAMMEHRLQSNRSIQELFYLQA